MESTSPADSTVPSTFAPSSSASGDVTLEVIMVQLQCMNALLATLTDKLCQVNTCVSRIARRQARLGGFIASPSPFPKASTDEDGDDGDDNDDEDEDASTSSDDEIKTSR